MNFNFTKTNKFFQSKAFKIATWSVAGFIVLLLIFEAGLFVGYKKAGFSYRWGENYHRNFAGPRGGFFNDIKGGLEDREFINAHGVFGIVIGVDNGTIIVKGQDNVEKTVIVSDKTTISRGREKINVSDIKIDDRIVIIGSPNEQGQIEARVIRVFGQEIGRVTPLPNRFRSFNQLPI